jgi:hypothetical protein
MKTLWCKNQENPSDRISHAWAPLSQNVHINVFKRAFVAKKSCFKSLFMLIIG